MIASRFWNTAKRLLKMHAERGGDRADSAATLAAIATVLENTARQEMGLGMVSSADAAKQGSGNEVAKPAIPAGLHGSFVAASRLLKEALEMNKKAGRWSECWRMLSDYEGLKPLLKDKEVDEYTLVGFAIPAALAPSLGDVRCPQYSMCVVTPTWLDRSLLITTAYSSHKWRKTQQLLSKQHAGEQRWGQQTVGDNTPCLILLLFASVPCLRFVNTSAPHCGFPSFAGLGSCLQAVW